MGKGRKENLLRPEDLTSEQLRERASKTKQMLKAEGVSEDDLNHQMVITRSLIAKAESGDVQAYNAICAMIGEKPAEKMEMAGNVVQTVNIRHIGEAGDEIFPSSEDEVDAER